MSFQNNKNIVLSFSVGVALSVVAVYFAFRNIPIAEIFKYLAFINYFWVFPAIAATATSFILRAVRWRIILGSAKKISVRRAYHPLIIGFMINCVLPGRLGEIARPLILQKEENIPFPTGLATVVAERLFDTCMLIILFILTIGVLQIDSDQNVAFGKYQLNRDTLQFVFSSMVKAAVVLIVGIAMFSVARVRKLIYNTITHIPALFFFAGHRFKSSLRKKICEPVINTLKNIAPGFNLIKFPRRVIICAVFTAIIWGLQAFSFYLFSLGSPGISLTYFEITAMLVIICIFISLPSVPGWWGLWEAGGIFALSVLGISSKNAAGFTVANHAIQIIPVIIAGFASATILSVNIRRMSFGGQKYQQQQPKVTSE